MWESGSGAVLDGVAALAAAGLTGFTSALVDVTVQSSRRAYALPGVRLHRPRELPPCVGAGIPRVRPEVAVMRAALWAVTERQAALIITMTVQQRLVPPSTLLSCAADWDARGARATFTRQVIHDACAGAHSLGELDFAALCRRRGLPMPSRQSVRTTPHGKASLDVEWRDYGLVVEIDGSGHRVGLAPVDDALRQNELTLTRDRVLRVPLLALRLAPEKILDQVERGLQIGGYLPRSAERAAPTGPRPGWR